MRAADCIMCTAGWFSLAACVHAYIHANVCQAQGYYCGQPCSAVPWRPPPHTSALGTATHPLLPRLWAPGPPRHRLGAPFPVQQCLWSMWRSCLSLLGVGAGEAAQVYAPAWMPLLLVLRVYTARGGQRCVGAGRVSLMVEVVCEDRCIVASWLQCHQP